ncbi:hypothetical protein PHYSODRAFT_487522 [Phytophthora sojae]|uniref:tRNA N(3)-methylcytidine methyltransferase n=1 Tax=Phytophthora sojae (strain P6497) TaxID=1094619 RepID=G4Z0B0_PHYSP|nr:hypothetical protein PHYSODRAFT_487522 [Phytophthora sojae]EGZ24667.1 hypothetical protein PHYSODRAFT_487522 [Phytophthora sojae]|eukprot:XP_009519955.1 hypothetical protein PHYSODRAFT_487522 [Phytophthora sojae]
MAQPKREVQLHSHDFEWEELAEQCRTLEDDSAKNKWDVFHQRNNGKVYKPRNYLVKEFPELYAPEREVVVEVLELGCGYGSAIFPILAECPNVHAQVCDFSAHAIDILKKNPEYDATRCRAFVCDIAQEELQGVQLESVDIVLMVFVLSAVPPGSFARALQKIYAALKPGGIVCFRDYGLYDLAMRRNAKKLGPNLYYRSDGTLAYFFSKENLEEQFEEGGFQTLENEYCTVRLRNRKKGVTMDRVWLHAKFQKPQVENSAE